MGLVLTDTNLDLPIADALYVNFPVSLKNALFFGDALGTDKANYSAAIASVGTVTKVDSKTTNIGAGNYTKISDSQPESGTLVVCFRHESLSGASTKPLGIIGSAYHSNGGAFILSTGGSLYCRYAKGADQAQAVLNLNAKVGQYVTVAMTWRRDGNNIIVDAFCPDTGVTVTNTAAVGSVILESTPIVVGGNLDAANPTTHTADFRFAAVAARVLSNSEITQLYEYLKNKVSLY